MEQNILISVIVPVYNAEAYLAKCIDSILAQTYENLEVILVDDGSKDASGRICDEYAQKDARIRVIHKENGGQSSARNMALDVMQGAYVTFVDSDDWIEPDAYRPMLALALEHNVKLVSAGRYDVSARTGKRKVGLCPTRQEVISAEEMLGRLFIWDNCDSSPCDKLFHRSLFQEIRFPTRSNSEDVAIVYRLVESAGSAAMLDKPIYNYFHRPGSTSYGALSQRTFYFEDYTETIYPYIRDKFPAIEKQARYFRVRALVHSVMSVELADKETGDRFAERCRSSRRALRKHIGFILTSPYFGLKERITDILLAFGVYRWIRNLRKMGK